MNIHHQQPFYQEDFSNSYNNNYYYDQNPHLSSPSYHPNGQYIHSPGDSVATEDGYLPPTYWSPDDDDKSLSSNPSSVGEIPTNFHLNRPAHQHPPHHVYPNNVNIGFNPESVVQNHIKNEIIASSCLQVGGSNGVGATGSGGIRKKVKGQQNVNPTGVPSKRKGVGGRRKSEKPPAPVVLKKRRLAANAR